MKSILHSTLVGVIVGVLAGCGGTSSSPQAGGTVTAPSGMKTTPGGAAERKVGAPQ